MSGGFSVGYKPDMFTKRDMIIGRYDREPDALQAAAEYARMYYGECSAITVYKGKKKIHTIPRRAGRVA